MPTAVAYCSDGTPLEFTWNQDHWRSASFRLNAEHWTYPATQMDIWLDPIAPRRTQRAFDEVEHIAQFVELSVEIAEMFGLSIVEARFNFGNPE